MEANVSVHCWLVDDDADMVRAWRSILNPWPVEPVDLAASCPVGSAVEALEEVLDGSGDTPVVVLVRADLATTGESDAHRGRREWGGLGLIDQLDPERAARASWVAYGTVPPPRGIAPTPYILLPDDEEAARERVASVLAIRSPPVRRVPPMLRPGVDAVIDGIHRVRPAFLALCEHDEESRPTPSGGGERRFWQSSEWLTLRASCKSLQRACRVARVVDPSIDGLSRRVEELEHRVGALEWVLPQVDPVRRRLLLHDYRERFLAVSRTLARWAGAGLDEAPACGAKA